MKETEIMSHNKIYWNDHADLWYGTTALPEYGPMIETEDKLHLFGNVSGKRVLEICCGSGHSLKYMADRNARELWGVDISQKQLDNASRYLSENGYTARLICAPMEMELDIPKGYFDYVYSVFGIGWTTDLLGSFKKIHNYLKKDGVFIFSWHHPLHYCVAWDGGDGIDTANDRQLIFHKSYFDESYFTMPVHDSEVILCNRKISTYVNALAQAGFIIEQMIEQPDSRTMCTASSASDKVRKAQMLPISVCFKAKKA